MTNTYQSPSQTSLQRPAIGGMSLPMLKSLPRAAKREIKGPRALNQPRRALRKLPRVARGPEVPKASVQRPKAIER